MSELVGPVYAREAYAGFFRRTLALLIDLLILGIAGFAMYLGWYGLAPARWLTATADARVDAVYFVLAVVYLIAFRLLTRGTPGYRIVGIRYAYIVKKQGTRDRSA